MYESFSSLFERLPLIHMEALQLKLRLCIISHQNFGNIRLQLFIQAFKLFGRHCQEYPS